MTNGEETTARPPIGDVGCSITVNGIEVVIVHGNIDTKTWGSLIGFNDSTNIIGKQVEVHAVKNDETQFSLSSQESYVKLLN